MVGAAVARAAGRDAHLLALALHPEWRNKGVGSAILRELDQQVIHAGAYRLLALVSPDQVAELAFANQGFIRTDGLRLYTAMHRWCLRSSLSSRSTAVTSPWPACGMR